MHRYRLCLLTTVVILAVASLGYADQFVEINIIVDQRDVVTAPSVSSKINKGAAVEWTLAPPTVSTAADGSTTYTFTTPQDLTVGLVGGLKAVWADGDDGYTLYQLTSTGFSVTTDYQGNITGLPALANWDIYSSDIHNSDGNYSGSVGVKISDHFDVPEPNSLLLLGAGFLSVPWLRARYRKRH
jgi:hypothetical protein